MEYLLSIGFSDSDNEKLQTWLFALGMQLKVVRANLLSELRNVTSPHPIFININSEEDIEFLKKMLTDFDTHIFACGVPLTSRKEVFLLNQIKEVMSFFLPLVENEIKTLLAVIRLKLKYYQTQLTLAQGIKKVTIHCEWQTARISISSISRQITELLCQTAFLTDPSAKAHVNLALEEALTNSIEHGNLELNSCLKPHSLFEVDQYELLKQQRLRDEKYSRRKIILYIHINSCQAEIRIIDEGPGFETSTMKKLKDEPEVKLKQILDVSGKGLFFIKKAFDVVEYRKQGREIILIKKKLD